MFNTVINTDLLKAKSYLDIGECVAIPTETVYGLAANALDKLAVAKIFEAKQRPFFDPLIIHTFDVEHIKNYVKSLPIWAIELAKAFMPGPLTLLLPKKNNIPDIVTSGLNKVAIRIPSHSLTLELLKKIEYPLAAPSANPFGYISPTNPNHVYKQLNQKIPMILDGGQCKVGLESTIIGEDKGQIKVYRLGGLAVEEIEKIVGKVHVQSHSSSNPASPGMLESHYAPKKRLMVEPILSPDVFKTSKIGTIMFDSYLPHLPPNHQYLLSPTGSLTEAASNLFAALRTLDDKDIDWIYAQKFPEYGLGLAINDRLNRASAKRT